jgi:hypothetical protein
MNYATAMEADDAAFFEKDHPADYMCGYLCTKAIEHGSHRIFSLLVGRADAKINLLLKVVLSGRVEMLSAIAKYEDMREEAKRMRLYRNAHSKEMVEALLQEDCVALDDESTGCLASIDVETFLNGRSIAFLVSLDEQLTAASPWKGAVVASLERFRAAAMALHTTFDANVVDLILGRQ